MTQAVGSVEGLVEQRNETGVRVRGQWYNQSKFRSVPLPAIGEHVRVLVDAKGFIVEVEHLNGMAAPSTPAPAANTAAVRLAVLQIAAGFASTRPEARTQDVLPLADKWLEWVERS